MCIYYIQKYHNAVWFEYLPKPWFPFVNYTTFAPVYLSFIPFQDVPKYCPVFKNKNYQFTNVPIISLLYFQNYLEKIQFNWGAFLVALLRITLFKKVDKFI